MITDAGPMIDKLSTECSELGHRLIRLALPRSPKDTGAPGESLALTSNRMISPPWFGGRLSARPGSARRRRLPIFLLQGWASDLSKDVCRSGGVARFLTTICVVDARGGSSRSHLAVTRFSWCVVSLNRTVNQVSGCRASSDVPVREECIGVRW